MSLDPNIPLAARGIQIKPMGESLGQAMQMRGMQQQNQLGALKLEQEEAAMAENQRELARAEQLRQIFGSGQPIDEKDVYNVVGPQRGAAIMKGLADLRVTEAKSAADIYGVFGSVIGGLKALPTEDLRAQGYASAVQTFVEKGWLKPSEIKPYSPEVLDQYQQQAMSAKEQADAADAAADNARLDQDQADKRPGVMAASLDAELVTEGRLLGAVKALKPGAERNAAWKDALAQLRPERAKLYKPIYSDQDVKRIEAAAMTAEQRLQASQRDQQIAIQRGHLGETMRHNRVSEAAQALRDQNRGATLTPNAALEATRKFRNDFVKETGASREVNRQLGLMEESLAAARKGNMAAGSQGILVTFQKILDPTSVVRESEYARSAAGQSLMNRIAGAAEKLKSGGAGMTLPELEQHVALARQFSERQRQFADSTKTQIDSIADEFGLRKNLITSDLDTPEQGAATPTGKKPDPLGIR